VALLVLLDQTAQKGPLALQERLENKARQVKLDQLVTMDKLASLVQQGNRDQTEKLDPEDIKVQLVRQVPKVL